LLDDCAFDAIL